MQLKPAGKRPSIVVAWTALLQVQGAWSAPSDSVD